VLACDILKSIYVFSGYRAFAPILLLLFFSALLFLFCLLSVLFLCICTVFVFYLCLCAGFIIGTCDVKPAR
jgi:hypothetical protein